jgi:hypothetical protein
VRKTDDSPDDVTFITKKMYATMIPPRQSCADRSYLYRLTLRVFSDENGAMWKKNVKDVEGEVLCVSQFTLFANTSKGNKPDFHRAMVSKHLISVSPLIPSSDTRDTLFFPGHGAVEANVLSAPRQNALAIQIRQNTRYIVTSQPLVGYPTFHTMF